MDEKLKVGRELDAFIAKLMFGVEVVSYNNDGELYTELDGSSTIAVLPRYSTGVHPVWQVVDRLTHDERLDLFSLEWCPKDSLRVPNEHRWFATFIPFKGEWCSGWGDTAAEAICRAAVEWTGVEDE